MEPRCRGRGVATHLLRCCWNDGKNLAIGLVSSHPHAVLALERATDSIVETHLTSAWAEVLLKASGVPYLRDFVVGPKDRPPWIAQGGFFADHREVNTYRKSIDKWQLGELQEGEEFVGVIIMGASSPRQRHSAPVRGSGA